MWWSLTLHCKLPKSHLFQGSNGLSSKQLSEPATTMSLNILYMIEYRILSEQSVFTLCIAGPIIMFPQPPPYTKQLVFSSLVYIRGHWGIIGSLSPYYTCIFRGHAAGTLAFESSIEISEDCIYRYMVYGCDHGSRAHVNTDVLWYIGALGELCCSLRTHKLAHEHTVSIYYSFANHTSECTSTNHVVVPKCNYRVCIIPR